MAQGQMIFKIFVASPSDVMQERETAFMTINFANEILSNTNKIARLEVHSWEHKTFPDAGLPQVVINKQIPVQSCDIFIGIFWKRFGSKTGTTNPKDGKPYLSGTQQEVDEAFEARNKSPNGLPVIMLYRKIDPAGQLSNEDLKQYRRVNEFFRDCSPNSNNLARHPALIKEFHGDKFQNELLLDLLQVVESWIDVGQLPNERLEPNSQTKNAPVNHKDPMSSWLEVMGLRDNPFSTSLSDFEPNLSTYFVLFQDFSQRHWKELITPENNGYKWFFWGDPGIGKTAIRKMLAHEAYPKNKDSKIYCIEFGQEDFERALELAGDINQLEPIHIVNVLEERSKLSTTNFRLFLSYAHEDLDTVEQLRKLLRAKGFSSWYDRELKGGAAWLREIEKEIKGSKYLIVLLSKNSLRSKWIADEVAFARDNEITIIPYKIEGVDLPIWASGSQVVLTEQELINTIRPMLNKTNLHSALIGITAELRELGQQKLMCLVDGFDQVASVRRDPNQIESLLRTWMLLPEIDGMTTHFFLPTNLWKLVQPNIEFYQWSRHRVVNIKWSGENLRELIAGRLTSFANSPSKHYFSLGQMCQSSNDGILLLC